MRRIIPGLMLVLLAGCSSSATTPDTEERVLGAIAGYNQNDPHIEILTTGRMATVRVTTYGNGCVRQGPTEVTVQGLEALVRPFDFQARGDFACPDILRSFTHEISMQFMSAGPARIRVRGLRLNIAVNPIRHDTVTYERVVPLQ